MSKFVSCLLLFLFISGTAIVAFNPAITTGSVEDSWTIKTPMKQTCTPKVVAVDGKIYAIGGIELIERYDPV